MIIVATVLLGLYPRPISLAGFLEHVASELQLLRERVHKQSQFQEQSAVDLAMQFGSSDKTTGLTDHSRAIEVRSPKST
eukprot:2100260-Amphidinium_carterae.1